jgi:ABC-type nickel/cobalt efflux system permease component RcnA
VPRSPHPLLLGLPVVFGLAGWLILGSTVAAAHPLGNFTQNRYSRIEVRADGLHVVYVLDLAEIPSVQETQAADTDHDGTVSDQEWQAYLARRVEGLRQNLELSVDGAPVALDRVESSAISHPMGQGDIPLIRIEATFGAAWAWPAGAAATSTHQASFRDRNEPSRRGWREIIVQGGPGVRIDQSTVPATDLTDALRNYPDRFLNDPLNVREASWSFSGAPGAASSAVAAPVGAGVGRPSDPFTDLITQADLSPGVMLLALLAAAALGGVHAASPGHGKTIMAAYIVGTRGTFVHALALGMSVTLSHTAGVLVLGVITLVASNLILPEQLYPWLTLVAAVIVLVLGAYLLVGAVRQRGHEHTHTHPHPHPHAHEHDHEHAHPHEHVQPHPHAHTHGEPQALPITWRNLFALGLAGGMIPSASALVVLLSALALGRLGFGLLLIVAFGVGMAVVLTTTGILLVYASRFVARYFPDDASSPFQRLVGQAVPVVSAGIMLLIGVVATVQALGQFGLLPV